ncbi:hypothetical protein [uncultured Enterococcus sp.]|nr:hypothetical protein [uncultured Enterococcus sp.]
MDTGFLLGIWVASMISMILSLEEEKVSIKGIILGSVIGYLVMNLL